MDKSYKVTFKMIFTDEQTRTEIYETATTYGGLSAAKMTAAKAAFAGLVSADGITPVNANAAVPDMK